MRYIYSITPSENRFIEEIKCKRAYIYCFAVKDLGYMFFERRVKPLEASLIQALVTPISRFAMSYANKQQLLLNIKQKETFENISQNLEQDKLKFETILGAINDGVIAINNKKRIFFANKSAHKFMNIDDGVSSLDRKYYEYFRLSNLDDDVDITREIELLAIQEKKWAPDKPLRFKANNAPSIICEINVQEIRDLRWNAKPSDHYHVITFHDITEAHKVEQVLAWQALHDPLTEILNRAGFDRQFDFEVENNTTEHHALIYMDLDRFKHVNDIGGHLAGDKVLKQVADLMQQGIRDADILARIGGDEFCILAKKCDLKYAKDLADRILEKTMRFRLQWKENIFRLV
ncbi:MAG: diguanylate cyclase (GGDEF)-like protein [Cocleimonas sp.]